MISGFDDIQLMELGFKQEMIENGDYYYAFRKEDFSIVTRECKSELEIGKGFTLIVICDIEEKIIDNGTDFTNILRILSK